MRALIVCSQCICLQQRKANRISDLHFEASNQCLRRKSVHSSWCCLLTGLETIDNKLQQFPKVTVHESERRHNWKEKKWLCFQFMLLGKSVRDRDKRRVLRLLFGEHFLERFSCGHFAFFIVFQNPECILHSSGMCHEQLRGQTTVRGDSLRKNFKSNRTIPLLSSSPLTLGFGYFDFKAASSSSRW